MSNSCYLCGQHSSDIACSSCGKYVCINHFEFVSGEKFCVTCLGRSSSPETETHNNTLHPKSKLIRCPDCEKEVSARATACPNCGSPIDSKNSAIQHPNNITEKRESRRRIEPTNGQADYGKADIIPAS